MDTNQFTWVKTHKDIVEWLKTKRNNQNDIIALLVDIGVKGIQDKDEQGNPFLLQEIDPFTFFSNIHKYSEKNTIMLQEIAKRINSNPLPTDVLGVPTANPINARLFPIKPNRINREIERLWDFFFKALDDRIEDDDFEDILKIENIGKVKLTEILFYINPERYICINGPTIPYLKDVLGISPEFDSYSGYINVMNIIRDKTKDPFYKISHDAWLYKNDNSNYWIFQANLKLYDLVGALNKLSSIPWSVRAHKESIKKGDKIII
ncbi:MAG: hypothetical protein JW973_10855 [Bacteroidales bacterium]|nr:hypothetical protein [Bacteroidales bacterium]